MKNMMVLQKTLGFFSSYYINNLGYGCNHQLSPSLQSHYLPAFHTHQTGMPCTSQPDAVLVQNINAPIQRPRQSFRL